MQPALLNPVPAWKTVAREQFRSVGVALRREALVAAGFVGVLSVWIGYLGVNGFSDARVPFSPEAGLPVVLLALLAPMAVWKGEDPARRGYHRAMPVSHGTHAVTRSLSGLAWTLAAAVGFFAWLGTASALTGGPVDHGQGWLWIAPFTGVAVMYLLGSALTLVTAYPWRWMGGGVVAYMFLRMLRMADGTRPLSEAVDSVIWGRYGIATVVSGWSPMPGNHWMHDANASVWLLATWFWLAIAISVFLYSAYRQPER
ncbi:MAG TPA: hypothetical protein VFJ82_10605 [Longimicrobium sp.]|nr:hypothetical protein [Longimicrobium sp.]